VFSGGDPVCSMMKCAALPTVAQGTWSTASDDCGTTTTLSCAPCYEVSPAADATITCTANAQQTDSAWNKAFPTCVKTNNWCTGPENLANGHFDYVDSTGTANTDYQCGNTATAKCDTNYMLSGTGVGRSCVGGTGTTAGSAFATTLSTGVVGGTTVSCVELQCALPSQPTNGAAWSATSGPGLNGGSTHAKCGTTITSSCNTCYGKDDGTDLALYCNCSSGTATYTSGSVTQTPLTCSLKTCPGLAAVTNGLWAYGVNSYSYTTPAGGGGTCDTEATVTPNICYELANSHNGKRTCDPINIAASPHWDSTQPTITPIQNYCTPVTPTAVANGNTPTMSDGDATCETTATHTCKECFGLTGTAVQTCQTGVGAGWTSALPTCNLVTCPVPAAVTDAYAWQYKHETIGTVTGTDAAPTCGSTGTLECHYCYNITAGGAANSTGSPVDIGSNYTTRKCNVTGGTGALTGVFTGTQPTCSLTIGATPPNLTNGYWVYAHQAGINGKPMGFGETPSCHTTVTARCDKCFKVSANPSSVFRWGGYWDPPLSTHSCTPRTDWCTGTPAEAPSNGQVTGSGTECGATRTYSCGDCYKLNDESSSITSSAVDSLTSVCQSDHTWSNINVSCHSATCTTLPPTPPGTDIWSLSGDATAQQCGANIQTTCLDGFIHTAGNLARGCRLGPDTSPTRRRRRDSGRVPRYDGTNPTCTMEMCGDLNPFVTNGTWVYKHQPSYGYNSTSALGSTATLTCDPCFRIRIQDGSGGFTYQTDPYTRTCTGEPTVWDGQTADCITHVGLCDATLRSLAGDTLAGTMTKNYLYGASQGSTCGDTVSYSCPQCAKFNISSYPNPEFNKIERTCQADGSWSGSSSFKCSYGEYKEYSTNMLNNEGDRVNYGLKYSPYECQYNITLCPECQVNIDTKCRKESPGNGPLIKACGCIAKNLCPKRCGALNSSAICPACDLTPEGVTYCAATNMCKCAPGWYGDGCQTQSPPANDVTTPAPEVDNRINWPWWWWLILACFLIIVGYCCVVMYWQEHYGKPHQPYLSDVLHGAGSGFGYWFWYHFLFGCFCVNEEVPSGPRKQPVKEEMQGPSMPMKYPRQPTGPMSNQNQDMYGNPKGVAYGNTYGGQYGNEYDSQYNGNGNGEQPKILIGAGQPVQEAQI